MVVYPTLISLVLMFVAASPAAACRVAMPLKPMDVKYADVVVIGRVSNYRIVLDDKARQERRELLAGPGLKLNPTFPKMLEEQKGFLSNYAIFDVTVLERIKGTTTLSLNVMWQNSTFGEPKEMAAGPFLMALKKLTRSPMQSASTTPPQASYTLLQSPCAPPFMFESNSAIGAEVRRIVSGVSSISTGQK